jgi:hypothetical protein
MAGKGDDARPFSVPYQEYLANHERTFGPKKEPPRRAGIWGTCGHEITDHFESGSCEVVVARLGRRGERVLSYDVICPNCRTTMEARGVLLPDAATRTAWLTGELNVEPW